MKFLNQLCVNEKDCLTIMCHCDRIAEELIRSLEPNCIQQKPCQPCQPCQPCLPCPPIKEECDCCLCKKNVERGKFGLAYIVETPRRRYTQPLGWEVEFEDTPSNISYNCNKMAKWASRPPIVECLDSNSSFCHQSAQVKKILNKKEQKNMCDCVQCKPCPPKEPTCVCYQEPRCSCTPKICLCCCHQVQEVPKCTCNVHCGIAETVQKEEQDCCCELTNTNEPRTQKHCKCGKKHSRSPDRDDCSCSKHRPKSRHPRRKVKQNDCPSDCDCLDYIPRKETSTRKESRKRSKEKVCEGTCAKDRKSNCTLTEKPKYCDRSCNWKVPGASTESDNSYRERTTKYEKPNNETTINTKHRDDQDNSTREYSKLSSEFEESRRNATIANSTRGDPQFHSTQVNASPQNSTRAETQFNSMQGNASQFNDSKRSTLPLNSTREETQLSSPPTPANPMGSTRGENQTNRTQDVTKVNNSTFDSQFNNSKVETLNNTTIPSGIQRETLLNTTQGGFQRNSSKNNTLTESLDPTTYTYNTTIGSTQGETFLNSTKDKFQVNSFASSTPKGSPRGSLQPWNETYWTNGVNDTGFVQTQNRITSCLMVVETLLFFIHSMKMVVSVFVILISVSKFDSYFQNICI